MSQDTLSDVLRSVRLRSAVFYYVSCEGTWYDVRSLTAKELESFIDDLARIRHSRVSTPTN